MRALLVAIFMVALLFAGCGSDEKKTDDKGSGSTSSTSGTPAAAPCACGTATSARAGATCACADIRTAKTGWCDHCGMGYAGGTKTTCAPCARAGKLCEACAASGGKPCDDCAAKTPK